MPRSAPGALARVRKICLALPETTERPSHGAPTFFVREKKSFVSYMDDHHGDGRLALWCAAPPGMQRGLVNASPEHFSCRRTSVFGAGSASVWTAIPTGTRSS